MIEAIVFVLRSGIPWRDLPTQFGKWTSVYSRWRRWSRSGLWERIHFVVSCSARGSSRFADSTHVKVHQHAANPAGGAEAQAIGKTKGGLNTKLTALVDSFGRAVSMSLHIGQRNDVRAIEPHLVFLRGRTLVADKGFDSDQLRDRIESLGGATCIPRRANCGGSRPFCRRLYRRRHRIENFFCRIKRHRRISTRYDKLASSFFSIVLLASILDWLKN